MKKIVLAFFLFFTGIGPLIAGDVLILKDGEKINCTINNISEKTIQYRVSGQDEWQEIATSEITYLQIDRKNRALIRKLRKQIKKDQPLEQVDLCHQGIMDANTFHKRAGGNFALGFFFGAFGVIGTAVGNPRLPHYYPISDPANLNRPTYMQCYQRRARGKNVGNAAIGWGTAIILVLLLSPGLSN